MSAQLTPTIGAKSHKLYSFPSLFLMAWIIVIIMYLPAYRAGFEGDFWGWLYYYKHHSFLESVNRVGFSVKSLYQVTMAQLWLLTSLFGHHPLPWFFLQTALHALNAVLLSRLLLLMGQLWNLSHSTILARISAFLFLIAGIQVETVVWKGSFHYLSGLMMMLLIMRWVLRYAFDGNNKALRAALLLFAISCFTLEIFYLTPIFLFVLLTAFYWSDKLSVAQYKKLLAQVLLPMLLLFVLYYIVYILSYEKALAHYDLEAGQQFTPEFLLPKWGLYTAQILFLFGYYGEKINGWLISNLFYHPLFYYSLAAVVGIFSTIILLRFKKMNSSSKMRSVLFIWTMGALIIVSPLWYFNEFAVRNGHYGYLISSFLIPLFVYSVREWIKNKNLFTCVICFFGITQAAVTICQNLQYRKAEHVLQAILKPLPEKTSAHEPQLLLNLPALYKGILVLPADTVDQYALLHDVFGKDTLHGATYSVSSFNMNSPSDGAHVTVIDSATIKVTLNQWGTWWWYSRQGAFSYENELYRFELTDPGHEYLLHLKQPQTPISLYFFTQGQWKKVDRARVGEEQW